MNGAALLYPVGNAELGVEWMTHQPDLKFLQGAVGGYIQEIPLFNTIDFDGHIHDCVAFCNEEGKVDGLEFNIQATRLWNAAMRRIEDKDGRLLYPHGLFLPNGELSDVLVGTICVLIGDRAFLVGL
jgi:hypothetical protein